MAALIEAGVKLQMRNMGDPVLKDNNFTLSGLYTKVGGTGTLTVSGETSVAVGFGTMASGGLKGIYVRVVSSWVNALACAGLSSHSGVFIVCTSVGTISAGWQRLGDGEQIYLQPNAVASNVPYNIQVRADDYYEYSIEYTAFGI